MRFLLAPILASLLALGCRPEQPDVGAARKAEAEERAAAARVAAEQGAGALEGLSLDSLTPLEAARVLAQVGEVKITAGDVALWIDRLPKSMQARYVAPDARRELLQRMVEMELLSQEARAQGFDKDPVVQHTLKRALAEELLRKHAAQGASLSDVKPQDVLAYFEANLQRFSEPERRRCAVLPMNTREEVEGIRAEIQGAIDDDPRLAKQVFGDFVATKSIDRETRGVRGDMGLFGRDGIDKRGAVKASETVVTQAFALERVHDVSPPFELENGSWAIAQLTRLEPERRPELEDVRLRIQDLLLKERRVRERQAYLDELMARTKVQIHEDALKDLKINPPQLDTPTTPASDARRGMKIKLPKGAFVGKNSLLRPRPQTDPLPLKLSPAVRLRVEEIQEKMRKRGGQ